jgi:hypothetical protein
MHRQDALHRVRDKQHFGHSHSEIMDGAIRAY